MKRVLVLVVGVLLFGAALFSVRTTVPHMSPEYRVALGTGEVVVDIADSDSERKQGLSGRTALSEAQGMLFIFDTDANHSFWMKDMRIAIDMIWLDSEKKVVFIVAHARPESYPASFGPNRPTRYVLEVPAGWAARHSVVLGSVAAF